MKQPHQQVCIVIPHYRAQLLPTESLSLARLQQMLGRYPVRLVLPQSLAHSQLQIRMPSAEVLRFDDAHFASVAGYNRLLLKDEFYAHFSEFDYILIHQLDAFIFHDELYDWCARGYDYVGAPWLRDRRIPNVIDQLRLRAKGRLYRWLDVHEPHRDALHSAQYNYRVGNGGLSLRRVAAMRQVLAQLGERKQRYCELDDPTHGEDVFFAIEANRYRRHLRIPDYTEAAQFSWEHGLEHAQRLAQGRLPFGCHGWNRLHPDFWKPAFARCGYRIDALI